VNDGNHNGQYTVEQALSLARGCKYGPLPKPTDPTPGIDEAIEIIRNDPTMRACNWITGQAAIEALSRARDGKARHHHDRD
jgi:hypothetical protein